LNRSCRARGSNMPHRVLACSTGANQTLRKLPGSVRPRKSPGRLRSDRRACSRVRSRNVATAIRKLLQSRRDGVPSGDVQRALQALEAAALRTISIFGAKLTNTMHAMAKAHYTPPTHLFLRPSSCRRARSRRRNEQNVANTLWAYATIGRGPGAG